MRLRTVHRIEEIAAERGWRFTTHHPAIEVEYRLSQTTLASFRDLLANGSEWIETMDTRTMQRSTPRAARAFGRMYARSSYTIESCFSCEIPDAFLIGEEGVVCTAEGELSIELQVHKDVLGTRVAVTRAQPDFDRAPRLAGIWVSLRIFSASNYCHWLLDGLSRVALLHSLGRLDDLHFVLPTTLKQFHLDSLRLFGVRDEQLVRVEESCAQLETLIACRTSPKLSMTHPEVLFRMSRHIRQAVLGDIEPRGTRRLYVSRVDAARVIVDEEELHPVLADFGFEIVRCERLTFAEQVALFAQASVVLGPHGAGLVNLAFSPPGTTAIEIYNPLFFSDNIQRLCGLYEHRHWHLYGSPVDGGMNDISLDPTKLRALLELACPL